MRKGKRISVVIPALNESRAISRVIADVPDWVDEIVVADNGSSDGTPDVARRHGAKVVHETERGYGAACLAGIAACRNADVIVFLDGDYSDHPDELGLLVDPVVDGNCEFVIGSRVAGRAERGALTIQQRFGNWLACKLMNGLWRTCYTDLGPFRAIDARALDRLRMQDRTYGWTVEMQIKAALLGLSVQEVPVSYRPRIGVSKISGTIKGTILAGTKILGLIGRYALRPRLTAPASLR
ncbi:MAG: glycosyltransferase family 2 protein [Hyphomicrobiaceae bacterium]|nr:glycosyltransferase family 2 protein [Hyphomicrobiaceae bacterium]